MPAKLPEISTDWIQRSPRIPSFINVQCPVGRGIAFRCLLTNKCSFIAPTAPVVTAPVSSGRFAIGSFPDAPKPPAHTGVAVVVECSASHSRLRLRPSGVSTVDLICMTFRRHGTSSLGGPFRGHCYLRFFHACDFTWIRSGFASTDPGNFPTGRIFLETRESHLGGSLDAW